jgi:RNA polymerase sigma factor (sigma-70 family)
VSEAAVPGRSGAGAGIERVLSDGRLAQRAVKGDERAFAAIFRRYHQPLYRYCAGILGDPQDAQDALQNTMIKVLRALPGEERRIELKPWLYRIAHNESIELLRRRRETRRLDPELAATGPGPAEDSATRERLRRLLSDLDELPQRQRGALVMRELSGLDFAEIAAALGTSPAVARQTLYEARLSLREMDEGREMSCETVSKALSDGDGRVTRRRDVRAHLRSCASCRHFRTEIEGRKRDLAALSPLPAAAAAGLLHGLLGGHGGGGGGLAGALGGGAAKSIGVSAALKGAATVAVVAAIGVTAADRGGLIHLGLPGKAGSAATQSLQPGGTGAGGHSSQGQAQPAAGTTARLRAAARRKHRQASRAANATGPVAAADNGAAGAADHPHGRGHEKQLPSASAHGQQTAATHKAAAHGSGKSHPPKPAHPSTPSPGRTAPPSHPDSGAPPPQGHPAPEANAAPESGGGKPAGGHEAAKLP